MKKLWPALVGAGAVVALAMVASRPSTAAHEAVRAAARPSPPPRIEAMLAEAARPVAGAREEKPVVDTTMPSSVREIVRSVAWERVARLSMSGHAQPGEPALMEYLMRMKDLRELCLRDPSLAREAAHAVLLESTRGQAAAAGVALTDAQVAALDEQFATVDLSATMAPSSGLLESIDQSLAQHAVRLEGLERVIGASEAERVAASSDPMPAALTHRVDGASNVAEDWMRRYGIDARHRTEVAVRAREYVASVAAMHGEYASAGARRRTEIARATVAALRRSLEDVAPLVPEARRAVVLAHGVRIPLVAR